MNTDTEDEVGREGNTSNKLLSHSDTNGVQEVTSKENCTDSDSHDDGIPYDRGWAWVVVFGGFMNFGILSGYVKATGVFFVELLDHFQSSNTHTALLFAVKGALYSIGGMFIMNVVVGRLGSRKTVLIGAACLSLSAILASLANDLTLLILMQAVLLGLGDVMVISPAEVLIAAYFRRRRSLAIAIAKCGASIGAMTIPPLVVYLLSQFGLKGAFLLTGGVCLHCFPNALLLRPTSYFSTSKHRARRAKGDRTITGETLELAPSGYHQELSAGKFTGNKEEENYLDEMVHFGDETVRLSLLELNKEPRTGGGCTGDIGDQKQTLEAESEREILLEEHDENAEHSLKSDDRPFSRCTIAANTETQQNTSVHNAAYRVEKQENKNNGKQACQSRSGQTETRSIKAERDGNSTAHSEKKSCSQRVLICLKSCAFMLDFSLFRLPSFRLLFACFALFPTTNIAVNYLPVVASESGVTETQVANLLTIIGALDLVSRLGSGVVADRKFLRVSTMIVITFVILGVTYHCVRFMTSFSSFVVLAVIQGLLGSVVNCMIPVLVLDSVGLQDMAKGIGFYQVAAGTFQAAVHPVLGQIRDLTGSYVTVYHVLGGFSLLAAILLALETPVKRLDARINKTTQNCDIELNEDSPS